jgi:cell filamentation protein
MSPVSWRWEEKDFGFRFKTGRGARATEFYQATEAGQYYVVTPAQCKLTRARVEELNRLTSKPAKQTVVANPWRDYGLHWDHIQTEDGISFNYAGCLDQDEIERREDEGVGRAYRYIESLAQREEPIPLTVEFVRQVHRELMGEIYPFAGEWRRVHLSKGGVFWPLPPIGIEPFLNSLENDVFSRSPFLSEDDEEVFAYMSEVMCELIAIHPFREGNGRTAFMVGNLILLQNSLIPLDVYERRVDQARYYAACNAGRDDKNYEPLAELIAEWEDNALRDEGAAVDGE